MKQVENSPINKGPAIHQRITLVWPHKGNHHYSHAISNSLKKMGFIVDMIDYREDRDNLEDLFKDINADLVIVGRGEGIHPKLIDDLPYPTLLWYGEHIAGRDEAALARLREVQFNAAAFDYLIWLGENDTDAMQIFRNIACNRIGYVYPCRFDPSIYKKLDLPKIYDVSFVGSLTHRRKQMLEILAKKFKVEFRNIWDVEEQVRFFNQSKIVLHINFAHFIATNSVNMRAYDVMGSGSLMLHEDVVFHKHFKHKKHLVYWKFNDIDDLIEKIEYYLVNEEEREKIAETGYRHMQNNFCVDKSIQDLINKVDFALYAPSLYEEGFGLAFDKWGRQTKKTNEFHKALEPILSHEYAQSFYERGKINYQLQRWQQAVELLEKALEKGGDLLNAMYLLALSYKELNRFEDSIRQLRRFLGISPLHAEANLALGELYSMVGDIEQGRYYKQKGLKLTPVSVH
jgi:spore maturation protein CgeB